MVERGRIPKGKPRLKEIVDAHLHREGLSPSMLDVIVEDRAAEGGTRAVAGVEIRGASGGFIDLVDGGRIPFHRVREVRSQGAVVYRRPAKP